MSDRATYLLMASYMSLFAVLFVCVFGAIVFIVREQTASEDPLAAPSRQRVERPASAIDEAAVRRAPGRTMAPPTRILPTS